MSRKFTLDDPEVKALLENVYKNGPKHFFKVGPNGEQTLYPLRKHLMQLGIQKSDATALMKAADLPCAKYTRKAKPRKKPQPVQQTEEEIAKQLALEEKKAIKLAAREASITRRYSLVRQGDYHGVYDEESGGQILFHSLKKLKRIFVT